ncbi:CU044_5270 family protein [Dactylosporangium sp. AC04546]|uniref:CU044_5270 family protein n=1 Tax=Dactylosporangium sp. AC04546 TaxID=2862460 RepID=UPI001EE110D5|nr:CU044_5270 family protein [Dactylosporangium sp. AC04546]WVK84287.1 CU044_5270 family protein [Dactylosporangium sp. AC04546]
MSKIMRSLAEARPSRLTAESTPDDVSMIMSYPRPAARRRTPARRLVLAGAGLAAVAAVTAAVALRPSAPGVVSVSPPASSAAAAPTDLLLVAAQHNDAKAVESGRYWVVRAEHGSPKVTDEQWLATRAGDPTVAYVRGSSGGWTVRPMQGHTADNNFLVAGLPRSAAQLAALPAEPGALKARLLDWYAEKGSGENRDEFLFYSGAGLVLDLPVPAPVRAAAYRMLAQLPGIEVLGPVTDALGRGGVAVGYNRRGDFGAVGQQRLVIDPATGEALAQESWTDGVRNSYRAILKARWSDSAPPAAADLD